MAYKDDVLALDPDHLWTFNNTLIDEGVGSDTISATLSGAALVATPICQDATHSLETDALTDEATIGAPNDMGGAANSRLVRGGWFELDSAETPSLIFGEGGGSNNLIISLANANALLCSVTFTSINPDVYEAVASVPKLEPGRPYHIFVQYDSITQEFQLFLNGQLQPIEPITDVTAPDHSGTHQFGGGGSYAQSTTSVTYNAALGRWAYWASWSKKILTETEVREELFEKGATETLSQARMIEIPDGASAGLFLLSAVGGAAVSEIDTVLKAYEFEPYVNLTRADDNKTVQGNYAVTITTPVRARVVQYGQRTFEADNSLDRLNNTIPFFLLPDPKTTESDEAIVRAYTDITNTARMYDFSRVLDLEFPEYGFDIFTPDGDVADAGDLDITIDQNALRSVTISEDTITNVNLYEDETDALGLEDIFYFDGDTTDASDYVRNDPVVVVVETTIPSNPDGWLWELGGTGLAGGICFTSGELVVRAGDGASATEPNLARVSIDVSATGEDLIGRTGYIIAELDPDDGNGSVSVWWQDLGDRTIQPKLLGTATAASNFSDFAGSGAGAVGIANGPPNGETTNDYNGSIVNCRVWNQTNFTLTNTTFVAQEFARAPAVKSYPMALTLNRASVTGSQTENFSITTSSNDVLQLKVDGGASQTVTLTSGTRTAQQIADDINAQTENILASDDSGSVKIESILPQGGTGSSVEIETVANNAYTTLGFSVGVTTASTNELSIRSLTDLSSSAAFSGIRTTGQVTVEDGTGIDGLTIDGDLLLSTAQDLTNVTVSGDLRIATGADSTLNFSNVFVSGSVFNDSASNTLTINASDSFLSAGDPGTGNGQTNIVSSVPVQITVVDTAGSPIENARVYLETSPGGVEVFDGSDGTSLTNASGQVATSFAGTTPVNITGRARKSSSAPFYKTGVITGQISTSGLDTTVVLVLDQ